MKTLKFILCVCTVTLFFGCTEYRDVKPMKMQKEYKPVAMISPEEMQLAMERASAIGSEHLALKELVGNWKTEARWWMDPQGKPEITKGRAVVASVFGGRFVRETFTGTWMGQKFEGVGYLGYDNVLQQYTATWIDSVSTATMNGTGKYDPTTKSWSYISEMSCPMTNDQRTFKSVRRIIDRNHFVLEMYDQGPDGQEYKSMEIDYRRA